MGKIRITWSWRNDNGERRYDLTDCVSTTTIYDMYPGNILLYLVKIHIFATLLRLEIDDNNNVLWHFNFFNGSYKAYSILISLYFMKILIVWYMYCKP